jgi:hypothetical protein
VVVGGGVEVAADSVEPLGEDSLTLVWLVDVEDSPSEVVGEMFRKFSFGVVVSEGMEVVSFNGVVDVAADDSLALDGWALVEASITDVAFPIKVVCATVVSFNAAELVSAWTEVVSFEGANELVAKEVSLALTTAVPVVKWSMTGVMVDVSLWWPGWPWCSVVVTASDPKEADVVSKLALTEAAVSLSEVFGNCVEVNKAAVEASTADVSLALTNSDAVDIETVVFSPDGDTLSEVSFRWAVLDSLITAVVITAAVVSLPAIPVVETSVPNEDSSVVSDSDVKLEAVVPLEVDSLDSTVVPLLGDADVDSLNTAVVVALPAVVVSLLMAVVVSLPMAVVVSLPMAVVETGADVVDSLPGAADVDSLAMAVVNSLTMGVVDAFTMGVVDSLTMGVVDSLIMEAVVDSLPKAVVDSLIEAEDDSILETGAEVVDSLMVVVSLPASVVDLVVTSVLPPQAVKSSRWSQEFSIGSKIRLSGHLKGEVIPLEHE